MDYLQPEVLASSDWLAAHVGDPNIRLIDCGTQEAYRRAHVPGAVALGVHNFIKEPGPQGADHGTFIMGPREFEELMSGLGVGPETTVVTYDDNNALAASRLWWVLRYYGHTQAKVLDGGWQGWVSEGRPVTFHATTPAPARFTAKPDERLIADAEYLVAACERGEEQILDSRTDGEWDGTNSRGNARAGRVPGARHLEWLNFVAKDDNRRFLPADELQRLIDEAGFTREAPIITYCQGGIRAAHAAFVLHLMGYDDIRVYDGSMRDWANRQDTPLVV